MDLAEPAADPPPSIAPRVLRFTSPSTSSDTRADVAASLDLFDAIGMVAATPRADNRRDRVGSETVQRVS